jgi:hypothetical protein
MGEKWTHLGHKSEAADSSPSNKSIHLPPSPVRMHRSLDRSYTAFLRRPSRIGRKKCGMDPHFLTGLVASDIQLERSWFGEMDRSAFHLFCMNGEASPHCRNRFISLRAHYGNTKAESGCAECDPVHGARYLIYNSFLPSHHGANRHTNMSCLCLHNTDANNQIQKFTFSLTFLCCLSSAFIVRVVCSMVGKERERVETNVRYHTLVEWMVICIMFSAAAEEPWWLVSGRCRGGCHRTETGDSVVMKQPLLLVLLALARCCCSWGRIGLKGGEDALVLLALLCGCCGLVTAVAAVAAGPLWWRNHDRLHAMAMGWDPWCSATSSSGDISRDRPCCNRVDGGIGTNLAKTVWTKFS